MWKIAQVQQYSINKRVDAYLAKHVFGEVMHSLNQTSFNTYVMHTYRAHQETASAITIAFQSNFNDFIDMLILQLVFFFIHPV